MDGLPLTNAADYVEKIDELWNVHLSLDETPPSRSEDSQCFFLMYSNVALNSMVCGPIFRLGDEAPTWDYYPLETLLSQDGRSLQAVPRGNFAPDYPMSAADSLHRPDHARPSDGTALSEPPAPVTDDPVVFAQDMPEDRHVIHETPREGPVAFTTDPLTLEENSRCITIHRIVWSTVTGRGAATVAAPPGTRFLTLETTPDCDAASLPSIGGATPPEPALAATRLIVDGVTIAVPEWDGTGSYVVPVRAAEKAAPTHAQLVSSYRGAEVSINLLTGQSDPITRALNEGTPQGTVSGATTTLGEVPQPWQLSGVLTERAVANDLASVPALLLPHIPSLGPAGAGQVWLVVGLNLWTPLSGANGRVATGGTIETSAVVTVGGQQVPAQIITVPPTEPFSRQVAIAALVPDTTRNAEVGLQQTLRDWRDRSGAPLAEATVTFTAIVAFE